MNKYENGKIYKIVCNITNEIYIGSTIENLTRRLKRHMSKKDCLSKNIIERGDYKIELIRNYPCNNRIELLWEERRHIDNNNCINTERPITTKEEQIEYRKNWRKENKNIKINCECGSIIQKQELARHKKSKKHLNYINNK